MTNNMKSMFRLVAILGIGVILAGCATSSPAEVVEPTTENGALVINGEEIADAELFAAAQAEGELLFYGTFAKPIMDAVIEEFTADTGIKVEHVRLQGPPMYERIMTELGANQLKADVFDFTDISLAEKLYAAGLYEDHVVPADADIPADMKHYNGGFYTISRALFGIAYNTALLDPADVPTDLDSLLDPKYSGQLGLTTIKSNTLWGNYIALYDAKGEEYWSGLAAQQPRFYDSVTLLTEDLVRGEITVALGHVGSVVQLIKDGAPIAILLDPTAISAPAHLGGLSSKAEHPNAAKVFLNWRLSARGSQVFADESNEYPSNPNYQVPDLEGVSIPHPDDARIFTPTVTDLTDRRLELEPRWNQIFGR